MPDLFLVAWDLPFSEIECDVGLHWNAGSARYGKSRRVVRQEATKSGRTRGSKHLRGPRIGENEIGVSPASVVRKKRVEKGLLQVTLYSLSILQYKLWFNCNVVNFSSMLSGLQYSAFCNSVNYVEVHNYFLMSSLVNWLFVINRSNVATASHPYKCRKRESILLKYPYLVVIIRKSLLLPWYACLKIFFFLFVLNMAVA